MIASLDDLSERFPRYRPPPVLPDTGIALQNLARLHAAGVLIAAGSDAGNIGTLHGPALHRELALMAQAGLSPRDILVAATRNGAITLGREAELGTLQYIPHTRRSSAAVVTGGVLYRPERLLPD